MFTVQIDTIRTQERGTVAVPLARTYMPLEDYMGMLRSALKDKDCPNKVAVGNMIELLTLLEDKPAGVTTVANLRSLLGKTHG